MLPGAGIEIQAEKVLAAFVDAGEAVEVLLTGAEVEEFEGGGSVGQGGVS
jgi:hypothetical protein